MPNRALSAEQSAHLKILLRSINESSGAWQVPSNKPDDLLVVYRMEVKPVLDEIIPLMRLIPEFGVDMALGFGAFLAFTDNLFTETSEYL